MSLSSSTKYSNIEFSNASNKDFVQNCVTYPSYESLNSTKSRAMISSNMFSISGTISACSFASDELQDESILEETGRISLAYENLQSIPRHITEKFASKTKVLDLSYNNFQNLSFLTFFDKLHTLILDRNTNLDVNTLPRMTELKILWLNNCDISNITDWIHRIKAKCPSLEQLSIMGNPGSDNKFIYTIVSSHTFNDPLATTQSFSNYREYVLNVLPNLKYLDCIPTYSLLLDKVSYQDSSDSSSNSIATNSSPQSLYSLSDGKVRTNLQPTRSLKDLFYSRKRKNSYQSSTN